jgi:hypothetical protein
MDSATARFRLHRLAAAVFTIVTVLPSLGCATHGRLDTRPTAAGVIPLQQEIVSRLAGATQIRPGVMLPNRFSVENKQEARAYLVTVLKRLGLDAKRQAYGTEGGENIYAVLSCGRRGAEAVVLGAHYDSVRQGPGANDNATGVAAVMLVAAEIVRTTPRRRDLYFVFFDEEERGLRGSRAFAQMLVDEKRPVYAVHTIDQMGWDSNHNRAIELERPYDGVTDIYQSAAKALHMPIVIYTTNEGGSDHSAFRRLGFKAVGITEEYHHQDTTPFIHTPKDLFDTVDFAYLASTTRLVAEVMKRLASDVAP